MTWLEGQGRESRPPGERLAALMERPEILQVPGAHNPLAGLLAKRAGFQALYVSGGALTASLALPDLGVMTLEELCFFVRAIARATDLPLIVDGDTGYGEAINVMRLVRELEAAGAAAVQIEDQMLPKKCGHLSGKRLIPPEDMAAKVQAARRARSHLRIIARTDAAADGLEGAIARGRLYLEAGADVVFPEALASEDDFRAFARAVDAPLLANMTEFGQTPYLTADEFAELGYRIVIYPVTLQRLVMKTVEDALRVIKTERSQRSLIDQMQTRQELYDLLEYDISVPKS